jgi:hypothetical protein
MQHGDLDKTKVLKTKRDFMSDVRKPNSKSVLKSVTSVGPIQELVWPHSWIPETLAGLVWPPDQTCPASQSFPDLTNHIWLLGQILEAFPGHVRANPIP